MHHNIADNTVFNSIILAVKIFGCTSYILVTSANNGLPVLSPRNVKRITLPETFNCSIREGDKLRCEIVFKNFRVVGCFGFAKVQSLCQIPQLSLTLEQKPHRKFLNYIHFMGDEQNRNA